MNDMHRAITRRAFLAASEILTEAEREELDELEAGGLTLYGQPPTNGVITFRGITDPTSLNIQEAGHE